MTSLLRVVVSSIALSLLFGCGDADEVTDSSAAQSPELLVYSARKEHLIKPLFDQFTAETGIVVNYVTDSAGPLLVRLQAEGDTSPADILLSLIHI